MKFNYFVKCTEKDGLNTDLFDIDRDAHDYEQRVIDHNYPTMQMRDWHKERMQWAFSKEKPDYPQYVKWYDNSDEPDKMYSKKLTEEQFQQCLDFNGQKTHPWKYTHPDEIQRDYDDWIQYINVKSSKQCMDTGRPIILEDRFKQNTLDYTKYVAWYIDQDSDWKDSNKRLTYGAFQKCLDFNEKVMHTHILPYNRESNTFVYLSDTSTIQEDYNNFIQYFKRDKNGSICVKSRKSTITLSILGGALVGIIGTKLVSKSSDDEHTNELNSDDTL